MSCTLMYQPYAMSYSSSCERTASAERQKLFKFPHVPSPPDSSNSAGGSPSSGTYAHGQSHHHHGGSHAHMSASSTNFTLPLIPPPAVNLTAGPGPFNYHHHHHHSHPHHLNLSQHQHLSSIAQQHPLPLSPHEASPISQRSSASASSSQSRRSLTPCATVTSASATVTQESESPTSRSSDLELPHTITSSAHAHHHAHSSHSHPTSTATSTAVAGPSGTQTQQQQQSQRAQYLSANCVVYENYEGDSASEVDDHFSRALSASYVGGSANNGGGSVPSSEKISNKGPPMTARNFPPSFWNSAYQPPQPSRPLNPYASDFYGTAAAAAAMDYTGGLHSVPSLHHQSDPWHYSLTSAHHHHQSYHHHHRAAADLAAAATAAAYTPMSSGSRFNPAQYSSFLFPTAASSSSASRFGMKDEGGHWGAGGRYHPHESTPWSNFHLADYSAAAAHYSNITAASGNF